MRKIARKWLKRNPDSSFVKINTGVISLQYKISVKNSYRENDGKYAILNPR